MYCHRSQLLDHQQQKDFLIRKRAHILKNLKTEDYIRAMKIARLFVQHVQHRAKTRRPNQNNIFLN
jgi:hypothetical protein